MANALGKYLREMRGTAALREFAAKCNISHTHLDSIEKGIDPRTKKPVSISVETLRLIADGLNVDFRFLVELAADGNEYDLLNRYIKKHLSGDSYEDFAEKNGIDPHVMELIKIGPTAMKEKYPEGLNRKTYLSTDDLRILAAALKVDPLYIFCLCDGFDPHRVTNVEIPIDDITYPSSEDKLPIYLIPANLHCFSDTSSSITKEEGMLLNAYQELNAEGQEKLLDYADDLVRSGKYIKSDSTKLGAAER